MPDVYSQSNVRTGPIPEGQYVMLGDNRDISHDSRLFPLLLNAS